MSHINNPSTSIDSNEAALLTSLEGLSSGTGQAIVKTGSTTLGLVTFGDLTKSQADTYYYPLSTNPAGYLTSGSLPAQLWTEASGTLYPTTTTDRVLIGGATNDTTSALQVKGAVNFNDSSLTYGGINITSSGVNVQIGINTYAVGNSSFAVGYGASAGGDYSFVLGYYTSAGGDYSSAVGSGASAGGYFSSAVGSYAYAGGDYSFAVGYYAYAGGDYSFAVGYYAYAGGDYSSAVGYGTNANYSNSTVIGSDQSFSGNLNDNNAIGGITLGGYNPTTVNGENWLMILPGITADTPRVLIGASTVDDGTSALQVKGNGRFTGTLRAGATTVTSLNATTLPTGTLISPPAGLNIGDVWKDVTTSSQYPILRIRAT